MIEAKVISSLEKVFANKAVNCNEIYEFSMLKNEKLNFQIAVKSSEDTDLTIKYNSDIKTIIKLYLVKDVPVGLATFEKGDDYIISRDSGMYPDILFPIDNNINIEKDKWYSIWVEVIGDNENYGNCHLNFLLNNTNVSVQIKIINAMLPKQKLIYTNWYHADCICDYFKIKPFTDEFWRINKNFIKTAYEHGMNCILTPLFTPPLDTAVNHERTTIQLVKVNQNGGKYRFDFSNLKKWIDMCREIGIEYFEMSHFFTQWGAKHCPKIIVVDHKGREKKKFGWHTRTSSKEYIEFLTQFSKSLDKFIEKENLQNNIFFHISDEPSKEHLKTYKVRSKTIKNLFGKYKIIDALSDYEFYKTGSVDIPIPCENEIEDFVGNVDELWTYYCCCQCYDTEPNRFIAMPSLRNRIIGVLLYKYNICGFLQWGYNFYNTQYSLEHISPFEVTDAGGKFPSGDSFIVYPTDEGNVLTSLRLKIFYDAIQDISALLLAEKYVGKENILKLIGYISFLNYPHDENYLLELRNQVNIIIDNNC